MTDQFRFFNEFLISIKRRTIKTEERIIYSDQCETMIIKIKDDEYRLMNVLYVFNLKINLLFQKRFTKRDLQKSFDDNDLYMYITQSAEMFKAFTRNNIYIVNWIIFNIDKIALIVNIMISENELIHIVFSALSAMTEQTSEHYFFDIKSSSSRQLLTQTYLNNSNKKSFINENVSSRKRDLYILWYRRIDHLESAKLRNLHKITTLETLVFIIKRNNSYVICTLIKIINKRNHQLIDRKLHILTLIFINICDSFF